MIAYNVTDSQGAGATTKTRVVDVVSADTPIPDPDPNPNPGPGPGPDPEPNPWPWPNIPPQIPELLDNPIAKTITTASLLIGALSMILSPDIITLPFRLWSLILSFLGLRKKYTPWGVVYDSVTKQPLDPAYVVLTDLTGHELGTSITDLDGRYGFLTHPGTYKMQANKTNYVFPSQNLAGKTKDELYQDLYFGGEIHIDEQNAVITKNIPMDPLNFDWNEFAKKKKGLNHFYSRFDIWFYRFAEVMYYFGFLVAILALFAAPAPYNIIVFGLYILMAILRIMGLNPKKYGHVVDTQTGNPASFGLVKVHAQGIDQIISKRVTDAYGRYFILVPKGEYFITFEKKNEDGTYTHMFTSKLINAKRGIISQDIQI